MDGRVAGSDQTLSPEEAIWRAIFSPDKPLNLGPYLLGGMVDAALWGIMFQQGIQWYIRHRQRRQDRLMDKIMVCWMTVFGTLITVVTVSWIWQLFVVNFGLYAPFASLQYIGWYPLLGFAIAAPSQLFYLDRAQSLSPTRWLPITCILLIIGNLATAIVQRVQFWHLEVNNIQEALHTTYAFDIDYQIATAVATDLLLTFRILYILYRKRSGEPLADKFITRLIRLVIESQSPPTLIAVIYLIMSGVNPKLTVIPFLILMHNKVYIIPLFAVINSRRTIQKKMNLTNASNGTEMVSTTLPTSSCPFNVTFEQDFKPHSFVHRNGWTAMFGRLTRLAVDLIAISTIIAGIKKTTGFTPTTNRVKDASIRSFIESYLGLGETVFGMICGFAVSSSYFRRTIE